MNVRQEAHDLKSYSNAEKDLILADNHLSIDKKNLLSSLSDSELENVLSRISLSMPWQVGPSQPQHDADGFSTGYPGMLPMTSDELSSYSRDDLLRECRNKADSNPMVSTAVRGLQGRLTGRGFETTSEIYKIQQVIEEIEEDPRNRLYHFWPKYVARNFIDGELGLVLTLHPDGFVEVDYLNPQSLNNGRGSDESGIIFHPEKTTLPLFYIIETTVENQIIRKQIPSIFLARYPELISVADKHKDFNTEEQKKSKYAGAHAKKFQQFNGFNQFVVFLDKGLITRRATSHLRAIILWCNYYENLKQYEIEHKKSSGSYLWMFEFEDVKAFRQWLSLSDEDMARTGIMAKKVPGGSLFLPPGVKPSVKNPQLPNISESDSDIREMITSGLNEAADVTTGTASGTFASIKATRGPMSDRISDEVAYFERFLRFDFWGSIFFLKSAVGAFPENFSVREAVEFKNGKPKIKSVIYRPEKLIDFSFPVSETIDYESRAKAFLGSKHGPMNETVGLPNKDLANQLGFGGYGRRRLRKATEDEKYPKLVYTLDAESLQERTEGEPSRKKKQDDGKKQGNNSDGNDNGNDDNDD